jgi:hypothetical protein
MSRSSSVESFIAHVYVTIDTWFLATFNSTNSGHSVVFHEEHMFTVGEITPGFVSFAHHATQSFVRLLSIDFLGDSTSF